jgi:hypothetical protein
MRETRPPLAELTGHFLAHMFDGDFRGQWGKVAAGLVAMALPAGMLMLREGSPIPEYAGKYRLLSKLAAPDAYRATVLADEFALLAALAGVTGLVALLAWQSLFPSLRDYLTLAGLPIRSRQIFGARFASVTIFAAAIAAALTLLPATVAPFEFGGRWQENPSYWTNFGAQAAAAGLQSVFVFFAIVAIQGVMLNLLPPRAFVRVSVYVQGALFAGCVLAILRSWSIKNWSAATVSATFPQLAPWTPPAWFAALDRVLAGSRDPLLVAISSRALTASAAVIGLAALTYWVSYRRFRRLIVESPERAVRPRRFSWSPLDLLARNPRQRAVIDFVAKTLSRSRSHRMVWLAHVGFAVAIALNSSIVDGAFLVHRKQVWTDALQFVVLFWPLAGSVILLPGLKHVMRIPTELPANWIFRLHEAEGRRDWMLAVERFAVVYALGPMYAVIFPLAVWAVGWEIALRMTALQALASLAIFEMLFQSWQQLPFACSYVPGKRPAVSIVSAYIVVLGILVPMVSVMIAAASRFVPLFVIYAAGFGFGWWKLHGMRRDGWGEAVLMYEDTPAELLDLGIAEISSRMPSSAPTS